MQKNKRKMSVRRFPLNDKRSNNCVAIWFDCLCCGSIDSTIKVWNAAGKCVNSLRGHSRSVNAMIVWKDHLCTASGDKTIRKWNFCGDCVNIYVAHSHAIYALALWGQYLVSASFDRTFSVWSQHSETRITAVKTSNYYFIPFFPFH